VEPREVPRVHQVDLRRARAETGDLEIATHPLAELPHIALRWRWTREARDRRGRDKKGNRRFEDRPGTVESSPCGDGSGEVGTRGGWQSHGAGAAEEGHGPK